MNEERGIVQELSSFIRVHVRFRCVFIVVEA